MEAVDGLGVSSEAKNDYQDFYRGQYTRRLRIDQPEKVQEVLAWRTRRSLEKIGYAKGFWKKACAYWKSAPEQALSLPRCGKVRLSRMGDRAGCHIRCFGGEDASHPDVSRNVCILMKKRPGAFPKKFDRIVLDQVLEHILDPLDFLSRIHKLLTTQGALFISVPNIAEPKNRAGSFYFRTRVVVFAVSACAVIAARRI